MKFVDMAAQRLTFSNYPGEFIATDALGMIVSAEIGMAKGIFFAINRDDVNLSLLLT